MKKFSTLIMVMLALLTTQNVNAAENNQQAIDENPSYSVERGGARYAERKPDPDFKYEVEEMTYDLAGDEAFVTPTLLNPHKLTIDGYGVSDSELASIDDKTGIVTITALKTGDLTIYAKAKKSSKYGPSEAQCVVHIINSNLISTINFGNETSLNREGDGGWKDGSGYWTLTQCSWWIAGEYNPNIYGYTEAYLVSPEFDLTGENGYQVEFVHTCYYKEGKKDNNKIVVREVGGDWIEMEGINFPEPNSYAKVSSGNIKVPAELVGKKVQFAFMYIGNGTSEDSNWNIESFSFLKDNSVPTGIENVAAPQIKDNKIYDLQGRLVKNPSKGLYIMNGKKVIF